MFTGIIEEVGAIREISRSSLSIQITIDCKKVCEDSKIGDSIAVNGICLTLTSLGSNWFSADIMPETVRKTNLDKCRVADKVNLERALRFSDRLGGHIVNGHIDGTGVLTEKINEVNAIWLRIEAPDTIMKYIIPKGSIAVDGTSLTIAETDERSFKISLIPHTAENTILKSKKPGDTVNIESDVLGKYVEKLIENSYRYQNSKSDISLDFLKENGYI